ncbi:MAG: hypothetical protein PHP69_05250 [Candidatus Omnitrophica bacterium]|nr:hypothetical protein [Candidatus Omnitrophota bacterium]MDD5080923.1 hypothetical protein [Candidatus Omnitrophota bacterium]
MKKWAKPELIKIRLNPEQAILSCCDFVERVQVLETFSTQCLTMGECTAGLAAAMSS